MRGREGRSEPDLPQCFPKPACDGKRVVVNHHQYMDGLQSVWDWLRFPEEAGGFVSAAVYSHVYAPRMPAELGYLCCPMLVLVC